MRILHLCLGNFYADGYGYQENHLPRINKENGHDVLIIASTESYDNNSKLCYVEPKEYETEDGVRIVRLAYAGLGPMWFKRKIRAYKGLYEKIDNFQPDIIFSHNLGYKSVTDIIKYKKLHPEVLIFADTHVAAYNSGRNWLSYYILHRIIYKHYISRAMKYVEKYYYIGEAEKTFSLSMYKISEEKMEYFPLGGTIINDDLYNELRTTYRKNIGISPNQILFVHSGKMNSKKRTLELVSAFSKTAGANGMLLLLGSINEELLSVIMPIINQDDRIRFLGWKSSAELQGYLCACDVYCQPGSVSATFQNALCCRCAVVAFPHKEYEKNYNISSIVWVESINDIEQMFNSFFNEECNLDYYGIISYEYALNNLDYNNLATRYINDAINTTNHEI